MIDNIEQLKIIALNSHTEALEAYEQYKQASFELAETRTQLKALGVITEINAIDEIVFFG